MATGSYNNKNSIAVIKRFVWHFGVVVGSTVSALSATLLASGDFLSTVIVGGFAFDHEGNIVKRKTDNGREFILKEPSLISELIGLVYGGTVKRDENGLPVTNNKGKYIREE